MKLTLAKALALGATLAVPAASSATFAQTASPPGPGLKAGAVRIDITPSPADLPAPFKTVHDPLFARVVVLEDGGKRAAMVVADLPTIAPTEFDDLKHRIAEAIGAPAANVLLAVTHDHSAMRLDHVAFDTLGTAVNLPGSPKVTDMVEARIIDAVKSAMASERPARVGYATGTTPMVGGRPAQGPGAEPVEQTIGVVKVTDLQGQPIAFLFNSPLEPVLNIGADTEMSADVAGVAERYIEQRYGDKPVAIYTVGAWGEASYGARPRNGVPPGDPHTLMNAMGVIIGEDVLATQARATMAGAVRISGAEQVLQCPGKLTTPLNTPSRCSDAPGSKLPACVFKDADGPPVKLKIGLLRIGDLKIVQADADVTPTVWRKLKAVAPPNTTLVSLVYGPVHYVVDDAIYPTNSYAATATLAKRGCAGDGFVNTAMTLIRQTQ